MFLLENTFELMQREGPKRKDYFESQDAAGRKILKHALRKLSIGMYQLNSYASG
jgi:hypothetical protein